MLKQLNDLYKDVTERTTEIKQLERRIDLAQGDRERHEHYIEDKELEFLKFNQEVLQPAADRFDEAKKAYQDALARYQALTRSRSEALIRNHEVN